MLLGLAGGFFEHGGFVLELAGGFFERGHGGPFLGLAGGFLPLGLAGGLLLLVQTERIRVRKFGGLDLRVLRVGDELVLRVGDGGDVFRGLVLVQAGLLMKFSGGLVVRERGIESAALAKRGLRARFASATDSLPIRSAVVRRQLLFVVMHNGIIHNDDLHGATLFRRDGREKSQNINSLCKIN